MTRRRVYPKLASQLTTKQLKELIRLATHMGMHDHEICRQRHAAHLQAFAAHMGGQIEAAINDHLLTLGEDGSKPVKH